VNAPLESDLQLYRDLQAGALTAELSRKYFDYTVYVNLLYLIVKQEIVLIKCKSHLNLFLEPTSTEHCG